MKLILFIAAVIVLSACSPTKYIMKHCKPLYDIGDHYSCQKD